MVSSGTAELERKAFPIRTGSSEQGQTGGSPMGEGPEPSSSSAPRRLCFCRGTLMLKWALPLSTWMTFGGLFKSRRDAEQTETEGRRVPKEEGILEVDAKISLERERILEQDGTHQEDEC